MSSITTALAITVLSLIATNPAWAQTPGAASASEASPAADKTVSRDGWQLYAAESESSPAADKTVSLRVFPEGSPQESIVRHALEATLQQGGAAPHTLAEVEAWSTRLTTALRQGGFPIGQVLMTQEDWNVLSKTGQAVFTAFPGRVGEIVLDNKSRVNDTRLRNTITQALCSTNANNPDALKGCLFQTSRFERATQLLQDLPGVALDGAPQFSPGSNAGDVKAIFKVIERGKPYSFDAFFDNSGSPATGRSRIGISASGNNYFGLGEDYSMTLMRTGRDMWTGSLTGSIPVLWDGLRLNGQYSRSNNTYQVGSTAFVNTSNTYSLGLTYPFTRGLDSNVWGGLSVLHTDSRMDYGDYGFTTHGHIDSLRATVSANNGDRPQQLRTDLWSANAAFTLGRQRNDDPLDSGPHRAGDYTKLSASGFGRLMFNDSGSRFMTASINAQSALNRNLDSSEQLSLGGPGAVRAYRSDESMVDDGLIAKFDVRQSFTLAPGHQLQVGPFMDFAYGRLNHRPWAGWSSGYVGIPNVSNVRRLSGYGLGVEWLTPIGATFSFSAAKPFAFSDDSWVDPGKKPVQYWMSMSWNY